MNGWTPERRKRQAELIRRWKPWEHSTGPRTPAGRARVASKPYKGGTWRLLRELSQISTEISIALLGKPSAQRYSAGLRKSGCLARSAQTERGPYPSQSSRPESRRD